MSYYWKKNGTIYHWHLQCTSVPVYVRTNPDWEISEQRPAEKPTQGLHQTQFAGSRYCLNAVFDL